MKTFIIWLANRLHKKKTFKYRMAGRVIWLRKIHVNDLLYVDIYPLLFEQEKPNKDEKEAQLAKDMYNLMNEEDEPKRDDVLDLIKRCIVKVKGKRIHVLLKDQKLKNRIYKKLLWFSINRFEENKVLKTKIVDLYYLYKGTNYAHQYFGKDYLNKVEELSFNMTVHIEGGKDERKKAKKQAQAVNNG